MVGLVQDHAARIEAGFRNQWPSVNQWDQKTHGATSVPGYTEEGYHGYPSGLHAQQQQPEISEYDFHYHGRQDSGSRDSVDSEEMEKAASFASQGSQSLAVGQQRGQQQYRPYQAEGAARRYLEAAPEFAEEQRKERLYGHQHQNGESRFPSEQGLLISMLCSMFLIYLKEAVTDNI